MKESFLIVLILSLTACIPEDLKKNMDTALRDSQEKLADETFKDAIANIELHKVRFGKYPASLTDLRFLSAMDSMILQSVKYVRLDSGYQLDFAGKYVSFNGETKDTVQLNYPREFWQGLGCRKSNMKK
jgi:hypothetical protein